MPTLSAEKQDHDSSWIIDDEEFEQNEDFRRLDHVSTKQTIVNLLLETKANQQFNRNMIEYRNQHLKEQQTHTNSILEFQKQQVHAQQDFNREFINFIKEDDYNNKNLTKMYCNWYPGR